MQMINFPEYADLGMRGSPQQFHDWNAEISRLQSYWHYYSGDVLLEKVDVEVPMDQEVPLLFPVGLNLVKMMCIAGADTTFGEWEDQPVRFGTKLTEEEEKPDEGATKLLADILEASDAATFLWELELDRQIFGGGAFKIQPISRYPYIKWIRIPRESFFPIWDPEDPNSLLELYIKIALSPEQALEKYGYKTTKQYVYRVEHWTRTMYENFLDGKRLSDMSGTNPWAIIPFVYTPRLRSGNWFGESLTADLIPVQDELNMRIADIGDAVNYNAHPTRWGLNLPRDFNADNFPLGPNSMWNIGRTIGSSPKPEVGILEASHAIHPEAFKHLQFILDWSKYSSSMPPIAFGEDQGSQRSGDTLEIRMWPLLKAAKRGRAYLGVSLKRAARISAIILGQKQWERIQVRPLEHILEGRVVPMFYDILPRDQQRAVDEVVKLMSTTPHAISDETAQVVLGRGPRELDRIRDENSDKKLYINPIQKEELDNAKKATAQQGMGDTKKEPQNAK